MPTVSEVMTRGVEVIAPDDSLQRAAQRMDELNVGSLPVCDGEQLLGMITDRDITVRATAAGMDPRRTAVREVMSGQIRCCREDESTDTAMQQMGGTQIRRLPVVDARQRLVGIVSLGDLATRAGPHVDVTLREISSPSQPDR